MVLKLCKFEEALWPRLQKLGITKNPIESVDWDKAHISDDENSESEDDSSDEKNSARALKPISKKGKLNWLYSNVVTNVLSLMACH